MNLLEYYKNVIGKSLFMSSHKVDNCMINVMKIEPERLDAMLKHEAASALANYIQKENPDFFTVKNEREFTRIDCELVIMTKERFTEMFKEISDGRR